MPSSHQLEGPNTSRTSLLYDTITIRKHHDTCTTSGMHSLKLMCTSVRTDGRRLSFSSMARRNAFIDRSHAGLGSPLSGTRSSPGATLPLHAGLGSPLSGTSSGTGPSPGAMLRFHGGGCGTSKPAAQVPRANVPTALFQSYDPPSKVDEAAHAIAPTLIQNLGLPDPASSVIRPPTTMSPSVVSDAMPLEMRQGVLLAVGGFDNRSFLSSVERYYAATDEWTPISSMTSKRKGVGVAVLDGVLFAVGGCDGPLNTLSSAERYDAAADEWTPIASMASKRQGLGVAAVDGALIAVGGYDGRSRLSSAERYDAAADKWTPIASMTTKRTGVGVAVVDGVLVAVGGDNGQPVSSVEMYNAAADEWMPIASMTSERAYVGVAVVDGMLYAVGGYDGHSRLSSAERYDVDGQEWMPIASMTSERTGVGVAVVGGVLIAVGGFDDRSFLSSAERYDAAADKWTPIASMTTKRRGLGVAAVSGALAAAKAAALLKAAKDGDDARVRQLLEAGADIETIDGQGWTSLIHASFHGHEACVLALIEANLSASTSDGLTALSTAHREKHKAVCSFLEAAQAFKPLLSTAQVQDTSALLPQLLSNGVLSVAALAELSVDELQSQYGLVAVQAAALAAVAKAKAAEILALAKKVVAELAAAKKAAADKKVATEQMAAWEASEKVRTAMLPLQKQASAQKKLAMQAAACERDGMPLEMRQALSTLDERLIAVLRSGYIRLVRASWLLAQPDGFHMPYRQELEALEAREAHEARGRGVWELLRGSFLSSKKSSPLLSPDEAVALIEKGDRSACILS